MATTLDTRPTRKDARPAETPPRRRHVRLRELGGLTLAQAFVIVFLVVTLAPFAWTLLTSFKPNDEVMAYPPVLFPTEWTLDNYTSILIDGDFFLYTFNSLFVGLLSVLLSVGAALCAGYAAARLDFAFKQTILFVILAGMAIGRFANIIPLYFFSVQLDLYDTYAILVLSSSAFIVPLLTWLMAAYFRSIPRALDDAARIDGCNSWTIFWRILLPNMKPAIVAGGIIAMVNAWNEYILAATLTNSPERRVLPVAINFFLTDTGVQWGQLTAAAIVATIPIAVMVLALQRYFIQGLTAGALSAN
ncbi:carbohydrate ABC transporter permease [Microbacterium aurantiacum]|uniref:Carbohydrate ABC transporter permease n=1 Tax=Microbacterium aurantiacum TaxID=162393 RepID=A0AAJ2LX20_9MICO|nr:carbohydrate ABC transporter permease [Microbacterium aurantiacum]MDS0246970.1 carbohydrate ABC transporter permease [Microbacterium aurantiacum]